MKIFDAFYFITSVFTKSVYKHLWSTTNMQ